MEQPYFHGNFGQNQGFSGINMPFCRNYAALHRF